MSRPKKTGLDYFPFDVDYYDDFKIMDLLNEYGPLGTTIYEVVISKVYKNGYYLEVPLDKLATQIVRIIGNRWIKNKDLVIQVIQYCADIGLFDNALLTQSVITSVGIQRRYSEVTVRNKVDKSKYWLLEKAKIQAASADAPKNRVSATETEVFTAETTVNATFIPQKEIKENKSKLKESREEKTDGVPTEITHPITAAPPTLNYKEIMSLFNSICTGRPKVKFLTDISRRNLAIANEKINGDFAGLFKRVEKSEFLSGRNGRWNGCTFDWIFNPQNLMKILNGQYDNTEAQNGRHSSFSDEDLEFIKNLGTNL